MFREPTTADLNAALSGSCPSGAVSRLQESTPLFSLAWLVVFSLFCFPRALPAQQPGDDFRQQPPAQAAKEELPGTVFPSGGWPPWRTRSPGDYFENFREFAIPSNLEDGPDVFEPGPDMGDFPNSAYTLPQGRAYIEMAPASFLQPSDITPGGYLWPFLLRYGVTDDVEFRVFANGFAKTHGGGNPDQSGFSPLAFDVKVHLWDGNAALLIPASSLEVYIQTIWGSTAYSAGTEPSINWNSDLQITERTNLEWTLGYTSVMDTFGAFGSSAPSFVGLDSNQFSFQWAIEHEVTERLEIFAHGFYNGAMRFQHGTGVAVGGGMFYGFTERLMAFGSLNAGLTQEVWPVFWQLGFAWAL